MIKIKLLKSEKNAAGPLNLRSKQIHKGILRVYMWLYVRYLTFIRDYT